jgi:DNA repair protein RadC
MNVMKLAEEVEGKLQKQSYTLTSLLSIDGINLAKGSTILAGIELGKRLSQLKRSSIPTIFAPVDALPVLSEIRLLKKEHFIVLYLDSRNQLIQKETVSIGTLNGSLVHPREVFEPAIKLLAAQIMLAHNHPSGDDSPSDADIAITVRLVEAGNLLGIAVLDHIIVTTTSFYSFKEHGRL